MQKDKARDVARSVLPSTARKGARDNKRNFHAVQRHAQAQVNRSIIRHCTDVDDDGNLYTDPDLFDDFEDRLIFDGYHAGTTQTCGWYGGMRGVVSDRRDADKLGPLFSWAEATEKDKMSGWSVADKVAYFKAILPDTLQGRHALGHVQQALGLYVDEFKYGGRYTRPEPVPNAVRKDRFRSALTKHLSSAKGRRALRDFLYETVPVAVHKTPTNNLVSAREHAVDENGAPRYGTLSNGTTYRIVVDVQIPQMVSTTCDDCSFLRNDPLATTAAVNRFVDIIWGAFAQYRFRPRNFDGSDHAYMREVANYIHGDK